MFHPVVYSFLFLWIHGSALQLSQERVHNNSHYSDAVEVAIQASAEKALRAHRHRRSRHQPTWARGDVIVTTLISDDANGLYVNCGDHLFNTLRKIGGYQGPLAILAPNGTSNTGSVARLAKHHKALLKIVSGDEQYWFEMLVEGKGKGSLQQYAKLFLLMDKSFRRYRWIVFCDSDSYFAGSAHSLFYRAIELPGFKGIAFRENGKPVGKGNLYQNEYAIEKLPHPLREEFEKRVPNRDNNVGGTCLMIFDTHQLPAPSDVREQVGELMNYSKAYRFNDQGILNAMFQQVVTIPIASLEWVHDYKKDCKRHRAPVRRW